jgi:hypothetical protein
MKADMMAARSAARKDEKWDGWLAEPKVLVWVATKAKTKAESKATTTAVLMVLH